MSFESALRFVSRPDGRVAYEVVGPEGAPLVVAAPGMGDLRSEYRALAPRLVEAGLRVAMVDLRGHGDSDVGFRDHSPEAVGSDLVAILEAEGARGATLIGTSFAAASAVWAAAEAPARVGALVVAGPFVRDLPMTRVQRLLIALLVRRPWGPWAWGAFLAGLHKRAPADLAAHRRAVVASLRARGRFEALRAMMAASKSACEARLPEVRARSLVVMGSRDPDFPDPAAEARAVAERLRGEVLLVDGAGHYPHAERPEVVAPSVIALARAAASAASSASSASSATSSATSSSSSTRVE
jgi:pimeloyl-ACP methyl ester carboxylesterase